MVEKTVLSMFRQIERYVVNAEISVGHVHLCLKKGQVWGAGNLDSGT